MNIQGYQKLSLLDFPEKTACTVFTGGCNLRCPFCHNGELLDGSAPAVMDDQELLRFLQGRKGLLDGVAITGGEPLLRKDLPDLLRAIRELGFAVKLDTNGYRPEILKALVGQGLVDYVAMDIKNSPDRYGETAGVAQLEIRRIEESMAYLLSGVVDYEFRTTIVKELHTEDDIQDIVSWIKGAKKYFLQGFIDSGDLICIGYSGYDKTELQKLLNIAKNDLSVTELRGI